MAFGKPPMLSILTKALSWLELTEGMSSSQSSLQLCYSPAAAEAGLERSKCQLGAYRADAHFTGCHAQDRQAKATARPESHPQPAGPPIASGAADTLAAVEAVLPPGHTPPDPTRPSLGEMRARGISRRLGLSVKVAEPEGEPAGLPVGPEAAQVSWLPSLQAGGGRWCAGANLQRWALSACMRLREACRIEC